MPMSADGQSDHKNVDPVSTNCGCPSVAAFGQQNKFVAEAPLLSLNFLRPFHIADRGSEEV